jgi:putative membrane protein
MALITDILIALIALLHLYICWFEMFAWESRGPKIFSSFPAKLFAPTKAMAANQGLYNAFLGAGLIWALLISDPLWARNVALFFLTCVGVAGLYGAVTVTRKILYIQTVPACLAIASLCLPYAL